MRRMIVAALATLAIAGCGSGEDANNMGVTAEEATMLNDTENMLDASPDSLAAPEEELGNGEIPMDDLGGADEVPPPANGEFNAGQ
jgi:hypothetical protein